MTGKLVRTLGLVLAVSFLTVKPAFALTEKGFKSLHTFTKIIRYVEDNYVTTVDEETLIRGAIRGMLGTLDPHTVYMNPDIYRELKVDTAGRFDGIGIEVTMRDGWLTVVTPIKGSPADDAGVQAGDRVAKINGHSTKDLNLSEAVSMMRGKRGSRVVLTIVRQGVKNQFDIAVVRRIIKVPSVSAKIIDGRYGVIGITSFQQGTARALEKALKEMNEAKVSGLVLDMRKNPGGLLEQAVLVSDLFLDSGVIVTTESRGKEIDRREAHSEGYHFTEPMVVLVDGGSASAAEIVAGALQDNKRVKVLGTKSFGKGSVQTVVDLDDGSGLKLTIARYLTPNGTIIQDRGILPDFVVPAKRAKVEKEEEKEVENIEEKKPEAKNKEDYQLDRAVEYLKDPGSFSVTSEDKQAGKEDKKLSKPKKKGR